MNAVAVTTTVVAILGAAVVYGTDVFCAMVLRPAFGRLDDRALAAVTGYVHLFGDKRMPAPGVVGIVAAAATAVLAAVTKHWTHVVLAGVAVAALLIWLLLYVRISAPINRQLTAAALSGETPANVRALQANWDRIINARAALQGVALAALCLTLGT